MVLQFIQTALYNSIRIGANYNSVISELDSVFVNDEKGSQIIITDDLGTAFTFHDKILKSMSLDVSQHKEIPSALEETVALLAELKLVWEFRQDLTFYQQLGIEIKVSHVTMVFSYEDKMVLTHLSCL
jgi:hypothetical protein